MHLRHSIGIIGLGLIGGSLAHALRSRTGCQITAVDRDCEALAQAWAEGVIDVRAVLPSERATDPEQYDSALHRLSECAVVFLCVPPPALPQLARFAARQTKALLTDVAGIQLPTERALADLRHIGGHPLCGSEQSGFNAAHADLFVGAMYVLCPRPDSCPDDLHLLTDLVRAIGARPMLLPAGEHDRLLAEVSHLPHIAASALASIAVDAAGSDGAALAAGGLRDTTRIAASSPALWTGLALAGRETVLPALDRYIEHLGQFRAAMMASDESSLHSLFAAGAARRKVLDQPVERLGLIGYPLGHSLSPEIHQALLRASGRRGWYDLRAIPPQDLETELPQMLADYDGFNVTIPHKEQLVRLLPDLDPQARAIGAVNTVFRGIGYNTDLPAFAAEVPLTDNDHVLLLGAGGVARTMACAVLQAGAHLVIWARRLEQAEALATQLRKLFIDARVQVLTDLAGFPDTDQPSRNWILLNGTPVGMWPKVAASPIPAAFLKHFRLVYDTVYNPAATQLLLDARMRNIPTRNGLGMLIRQAQLAQRIWRPDAVFDPEACLKLTGSLARDTLRRSPLHLLLTGFMGTGKTTVGQLLAQKLNLAFIDLDSELVKRLGSSIADYFAQEGEAAFRRLEQQVLAEQLAREHSVVIATGGGALVQPESLTAVRQVPARVIWLQLPLAAALKRIGNQASRPMLAGQDAEQIERLFAQRQPLYQQAADLTIDAGESAEQLSRKIAEMLGFEDVAMSGEAHYAEGGGPR